MEKLLNEIKQYRKEQAELHEWTKKNGHPMTANYTEGGLDTCDKIIAIIERAEAVSSHENSGLNIPPVIKSVCEMCGSEQLQSDNLCKKCYDSLP